MTYFVFLKYLVLFFGLEFILVPLFQSIVPQNIELNQPKVNDLTCLDFF